MGARTSGAGSERKGRCPPHRFAELPHRGRLFSIYPPTDGLFWVYKKENAGAFSFFIRLSDHPIREVVPLSYSHRDWVPAEVVTFTYSLVMFLPEL